MGTRGSRLALRQTEIALEALRRVQPQARLQVRTIRTEGDRTSASLNEIGGRGVFVIEIEKALLAEKIDLAIHSLKDLPTQETDGLTLAAALKREDPRDALVSRDRCPLDGLRAGAIVGTGSPRRASQLKGLRPDLQVEDIRGNVDTRVRKVDKGEYDGVVLAAAGLARLGWVDRAAQVFEPEQMLPAVGQGILAFQARADDEAAIALAASVDYLESHVAALAERAFERRLGGGCHAAIGALAEVQGFELRLRGYVGDQQGGAVRGEITGQTTDAEACGLRLAEQLIAQGAGELLKAAS